MYNYSVFLLVSPKPLTLKVTTNCTNYTKKILNLNNTAIKIKHSYCDILICGTKLAELFSSIRCRELDTIKVGGEIENKKGKLVSVRSVYYENENGSGEEKMSGSMGNSNLSIL